MSANVQPLIEYLQQLQRKGETHVHLDEKARNVLREFFLVAKGYKKHPSLQEPTPTAQETEDAVETPAMTPTISQIQITGNSPAAQIQALASQAQNLAAAKALGTLREKLVFSGGNPSADIMFITDAPGFSEEQKGFPLAGPNQSGTTQSNYLTRHSGITTFVRFHLQY